MAAASPPETVHLKNTRLSEIFIVDLRAASWYLPREAVMQGLQGKVSALCKNGISVIEHRIRCARGEDIHGRPSIRRAEVGLGSGDGRWVISPDRFGPDSIVYSFGIGRNITFDLALIRRFGCKVHAFDPTPLANEWLQSQNLPDSFLVYPWGLAAYDGSARFALPESHSVSFVMATDVPSKSKWVLR